MKAYTDVKLGRCCYAVLDTNDIEVTRFAYESDAKYYAREANRNVEAREARGA
jgi:hypothetical protein